MSVETVLAVAASSFGIVMGLAPSLQIRRMLFERSSRDVSIGYFGIITIGSVLWASYGVSIANLVIVIPNVVGFLSSLATILVAHHLRRREGLVVSGPIDGDGDRDERGHDDGLVRGDDLVSLERNTLSHGPETDHEG